MLVTYNLKSLSFLRSLQGDLQCIPLKIHGVLTGAQEGSIHF